MTMTSKDLREKISGSGLPSELTHIPEWDCDVLITGLTGRQRDQIEGIVRQQGTDTARLRSRIVMMCARSPDDRTTLFSVDDLEFIDDLAASALDKIVEVSRRLSGISDTAIDNAKKNSKNPQSAASGTASRSH